MRRIMLIAALILLVKNSWADNISGIANIDMEIGKLTIPCVKVKNLNASSDEFFYDVILQRQGNSLVFELSFAEIEESSLCQSIEDFAQTQEPDSSDDSNLSDDSSPSPSPTATPTSTPTPTSTATPTPTSTPTNTNAQIFVECEKREDRSKISVKGKFLTDGSYMAVVSSGNNSAQSGFSSPINDEIEFDFDSQPDDIASGANAIAANFIDGIVSAIVQDENGKQIFQGEASCESK